MTRAERRQWLARHRREELAREDRRLARWYRGIAGDLANAIQCRIGAAYDSPALALEREELRRAYARALLTADHLDRQAWKLEARNAAAASGAA